MLAKADGQQDVGASNGSDQTNRELVYQTVNGKRAFALAIASFFLENNRDLDVKNGMLGTVEAVEPNALHLRLDGSSGGKTTPAISLYRSKITNPLIMATHHHPQGPGRNRRPRFRHGILTMDRHLTYVAMTRHRDVTLYAGRDELKDMKEMVASMGRSGVKETTLDYEQVFAERRGLRTKRDRQRPGGPTLGAKMHQQERGINLPKPLEQTRSQVEDITAPLVPAITHYDRTIDEVARQTRCHIWNVRSSICIDGRPVYQDSFTVALTFKGLILDDKIDKAELVKAVP